ncbi:hypothetical protein C5C45_12435 [Rathayibacter rathayi]|nr:hypothetical protein C5C45_12435 [Rathayibacter rathayi]
MAMIATDGQAEPRKPIRVFFAVATALLALSPLVAGGLDALQTAAILSALPFSVVMILMRIATVIAFHREVRAYDRARRSAFVGDIGTLYGLEVEDPTEREPAHPLKRLAQRLKPGPKE